MQATRIVLGRDLASQNISTPYSATQLTRWSSMAPLFGADAADAGDADQCFFKSLRVVMDLDMADEEENIRCTVFIVAVKTMGVYDAASGVLNTLTLGTDYWTTTGGTYINQHKFRVLRRWNMLIGNYGTGAGSSSASRGPGAPLSHWHKEVKLNIGRYVRNPGGNFYALTASQEPENQLYAFVFNDNAVADVEHPTWKVATLASITVDK